MAKMFYTLDEAAEKLGKPVEAVREMAKSGQIQEFRDRDKLMFKVEQIDLLAHSDEDHGIDVDAADMSSMIPLADDLDGDESFGALALEPEVEIEDNAGAGASDEFSIAESGIGPAKGESASAIDFEMTETTKERTGVSIFDADELETADPSALTQMTDEGFDALQLDPVGSGSGLLDLTRESDDTSLGAEFLDELYPSDDQTVDREAPSSGLFETSGDETLTVGPGLPAGALVVAEPLDGAGSGLAAGLSIGAVLALAIGIAAVIIGLMDAPADDFISILADNFLIIVGGLAAAALIFGVIGFLMGKKSG